MFFVALIPLTVLADSTICKLEESATGIKAIAWDNEGKAKITDMFGKEHDGVVTLTRKFNTNGTKTNIYVKYDKPYYGDDAVEFIIFPYHENQFRVVGVSYIYKGNDKFLNTSKGNYLASCLSL